MKKIVTVIVIIAVLAAIGLTLQSNKKKLEASAQVAKIQTEYPVNVVSVSKQKLKEDLSLVGEVLANNDVAVISETQGKVIAVYTKLGQSVSKGAAIAKIDDELKTAQLKIAEANFEKAKKDLDRGEALVSQKAMTESQLDGLRFAYKNAEANLIIAKRQLADTKIVAPVAGVVVARNIDVGSTVNTQTVVANVVDISSLKLKLSVPEAIVYKLKLGNKVDITSDAVPGGKFTGIIDAISAKGDDKHTFPIELRIQNKGKEQLKAGMYARVNFTSIPEHDGIVVPRQALLGSAKDAKLYVVENGHAKLKSVTLGQETNAMVEVIGGVQVGEIVITNGQNNIKDGTKVTVLQK